VIESTNAMGIYVGDYETASLTSLQNLGTIRGATAGVEVTEEGTISTITNSGTIAYTGVGTGPAVVVGATGVLGEEFFDAPALTSTGASALIDGTIQNQGTIHYGFTIANQSVTVSAGGGTGIFANGTLTVADGDLTFTEGTTTLAADVSVDGGSGTVFNQGTLDRLDSQTITGNFEQTGAAALSSGISDASTFGSLAISGTATFDGTLDLEQLLGFTLQDGQTFDLFSFASRSGGFSGLSVDGTPLSSLGTNEWAYGELTLTENWSSTAMSLSVAAVPEPSTLALAAAGMAGAAWGMVRRRKRA
jgi:hypothetical protein